MADSRSGTFAPLPYRAIGDERLTLTHMRVLAAICWHDRMASRRKNGQGCWASHLTLATLCNVNYTNLSTAIRELGEFGYVTRHSHPLNRRQHVYRVIYGDDDSSPTGKQSKHPEPADSSSVGKQSGVNGANNGLPAGQKSPGIVCPPKTKTQRDQTLTGVEYIPLNGEEITQKRGRDFPEGASLHDAATNEGKWLAQTEREHRRTGKPMSPAELDTVQGIMEAHEHGDVLYHQAERILIEWDTAQ